MKFREADKIRVKIAILLAVFYAFPLIYWPAHYLFVVHHHFENPASGVINTYHPTCKIDDFSYNEVDNFQYGIVSENVSWSRQFSISIISFILTSKLDFTYDLRAPPLCN